MIVFMADDKVIDCLDFEELTGLNDMIGEILTIRGKRHIPTGMVMDHDHPNRQLISRHAEGFSGFPERRHFSRNPKWGPSDFGCKKSGDGHCLRRPTFVLHPSRRALRAAPGLPQGLDAVSHGLAFRLCRRSRAALRRNARSYGYTGVVALRSSLTLPRFPVLLQGQKLSVTGTRLMSGESLIILSLDASRSPPSRATINGVGKSKPYSTP